MADLEPHPLEPFLPATARLLMLGSFPPPRKRWSMDFYYPNWNNDMWRLIGLIFFYDKEHFVASGRKAFCKERLVDFLRTEGIALYDTACVVRRLQDNASDKFLEVVSPTDIADLLRRLPCCKAVVTTGEKATDTFCTQMEVSKPRIGEYTAFKFEDRPMRLYRMPSTSRAYPLALEKKAEAYRAMFQELEMR